MAESTFPLKTILLDLWRLLTFRQMSPAIGQYPQQFLVVGLFFTWMAGIGRYWDHPNAHLTQYLGLGSLIYVFVLAAILWLVCYPFRPRHGSYLTFLTFVTLTSPPALLYAFPIERFTTLDLAQLTNALFLGVVAVWRVALLFTFLKRVAQFSTLRVIVAGLLPLTLIVVALALLNLEHVVFNIMSGIDFVNGSPHEGSYAVVVYIAFFSFVASPVLALAYVILAVRSWHASKKASAPTPA